MALRLSIKVVPASGKSLCMLDKQQRIKCYLKAPAEGGKANQELVALFAKICKVKQRDIEIIAGLTSRNKIIMIMGDMTLEVFLHEIGCDQQIMMF